MSALRYENLLEDLTPQRSEIVKQVKAQLLGYVRSGSFNSRRLADIVNIIRQKPESFSEWHQSETAKLFAPPIFRNEKKASGYFFWTSSKITEINSKLKQNLKYKTNSVKQLSKNSLYWIYFKPCVPIYPCLSWRKSVSSNLYELHIESSSI